MTKQTITVTTMSSFKQSASNAIPFLDLKAAYLELKEELDVTITEAKAYTLRGEVLVREGAPLTA